MSYPPSEATLANTTRLPVSDAIKFNMADRVHRLSLAASCLYSHPPSWIFKKIDDVTTG